MKEWPQISEQTRKVFASLAELDCPDGVKEALYDLFATAELQSMTLKKLTEMAKNLAAENVELRLARLHREVDFANHILKEIRGIPCGPSRPLRKANGRFGKSEPNEEPASQ